MVRKRIIARTPSFVAFFKTIISFSFFRDANKNLVVEDLTTVLSTDVVTNILKVEKDHLQYL